jgi:two-component system NarL family sensor kinase
MSIEYFVIIGIGTMFLLIISLLLALNLSQRKKFQYHQNVLHLKQEQQNELIKAAVISEETERHRISEELHDEVGALLSATRLYLFSMHPEKLQKQDSEVFNKSIELLNESIQKVRTISHNLHSGILKELGLNEAIQSFVQKLSSEKFFVSSELDASYDSKNPESDISIYRIIQELCGNIIKHSCATQLKIISRAKDNFLIFVIQHNGNGLTQDEFERLRYEGNGLGLKNIQNRIILLKGKINFERSGNENLITLTVPVNA